MHRQIVFSGLKKTGELPANYRRLLKRHGIDPDDRVTFTELLNHLQSAYGIEWADLSYWDEGSPHKINHYRALVNPNWVGKEPDAIPGDREDAVWHIPTKKYTRAQPYDLWMPLADAISELGMAKNIYGTCRLRREGGEMHMDVFVEPMLVSVDDEITLGISTGHDYYGNTRLYVNTIAYHDTGDGVGQIMRYLTEPKRRKHTGEASDDVVAWYSHSLKRLDAISDTLYDIVTVSMHHEVPLKDYPCTLEGFYDHLGLPNRGEAALAEPAGQRAVETAVGPYTSWHLYKAGMWAIEHQYDSRDTSSFKKHVQTVNELLFNPSQAETRVLKSIEEDIETDAEQSEVWDFVDSDDTSSTLDTIRTRATSISEGVTEFESTRERLQTMLKDEGVVEADDPLSESTPDPEEEEAE